MGVRSIALFVAAAAAEIGGAYLVWIGLKEEAGLAAVAAGSRSAGLVRPDRRPAIQQEFGRVLAAYGGVFVVGSMLWGVAFDNFEPGRLDLAGAAVCLIGIGMIMCVPR